MTRPPRQDEAPDQIPPLEGDWRLVEGFMRLPRQHKFKLEDVPAERLQKAMQLLKPIERDVLSRILFEMKTCTEIAMEEKTSRLHVWELYQQALSGLGSALAKLQPAASPTSASSVN